MGRRRRLLGQESTVPTLPPPATPVVPGRVLEPVPVEPEGPHNLADTLVSSVPVPDDLDEEAGDDEAGDDEDGDDEAEAPTPAPGDPSIPASPHAETVPPAPRLDPPPGLSQLPTPIQAPRQPEAVPPLPENFEPPAADQDADWFVRTGQPLPDRASAPEAPVAVRGTDPRAWVAAGVLALGLFVLGLGLIFAWLQS